MAEYIELIFFIISFVYLVRTVLIIAGKLKGPILRHFERYGPNEFFYQPLPAFLGWLAAFMVGLGGVLNATVIFMPIAILFAILSIVIWSMPEISARYPQWLLRYPYWLHELRERTGRYERRRMAYMWLRLPRRLKSTYNGNDGAFHEWADFVILGTFH